MPPKKDINKPKGAMNSYSAFVQVCREEHRRKHPDDTIVFAEFSKKCAERWKKMNAKERRRFEDIAAKDKARYQREMASYEPAVTAKKRKQGKKKDPNAPKRALSAFFHYCADFRAEVKAKNPDWTVGEIAKELGSRWEKVSDKSKYERLAAEDKKRYESEMMVYRGAGKKSKMGDTVSDEDSEESD